jgi:uncharacterized OB-fold protein
MQQRKMAAPPMSPENAAFWEAAKAGNFLLRKCNDCGRPHWYPRVLCPFCMSERTEWVAASGKGRIYSYSIMRRAPVPYAIAYVTLAEGPVMMTNIVECDFEALRIGQEVTLCFVPSEGGPPVPCFRPG